MSKLQAILAYRWGKYRFKSSRARGHYISFLPAQKALWYRVPKVASRTITNTLEEELPGQYYYGGREICLSDDYLDAHYKFGFTRNPVKRLESLWRQKVLDVNGMGVSEAVREQLRDFDHFIDWVAEHDLNTCDPHFRKQTALLDVNRMDFIGKLEQFDEDWATVAKRLGLHMPKRMQRRNPSKSISNPISPAQAQRIARLYEADFNAFYPEDPVLHG